MEKEVSGLRKDLAAFMDWAKQSQECNQKNLSILNENFNLLLKLFISKNDTVELGSLSSQHVAVTNKSGKKAEKTKAKSDHKADVSNMVLPLAAYEGVNDFSDDEDLEDSLRINPISFNMFPTDKIQEKKSLIDDHKDEKIISDTMENTVDTKLELIYGAKNSAPVKFTGKKFEQNLRELKKKYEVTCERFPNLIKLPESYLEYGAARGWNMSKIRKKLHRNLHRQKLRSMPCKTNDLRKRKISLGKCSKPCKTNDLRKISLRKCSPALNLTPQQLEANLKTLREEHMKSKKRISQIPEFYFKFGAARGWTIKQVRQKYYTTCHINRMKSANN